MCSGIKGAVGCIAKRWIFTYNAAVTNTGGGEAMKRIILGWMLLLLFALPALGETADEAAAATDAPLEGGWIAPDESGAGSPKDDLINRIIDMGQALYEKAGGKAQRAHYASDIYVCKNFTVYLFRQNKEDFRLAEFPDVKLAIPNNLPRKECKPYNYGVAWEDVPESKGNPFYEAAAFRYDPERSKEENIALAEEFMRQVKRGDYFQMSANYQYGVGAHSAIMIEDYDPETDSVTWMDSNMRGKKVNGIRYGIVQFGEVKPVSWWAEAFCKKGYGATLYRLRDDLTYRSGAKEDE